MDNGQTGQSLNNAGIFSPNPANMQADPNITAIESALNNQNSQNFWTPERNNRDIGNKAILSNEADLPANEVTNTPEETGNLGEIVNLDLAPSQPTQLSSQLGQSTPAPLAIDENLIKPEGDHISGATVKEINRVMDELSQTGNLNKFSDEVYKMKEKYLKNAFGRELAS